MANFPRGTEEMASYKTLSEPKTGQELRRLCQAILDLDAKEKEDAEDLPKSLPTASTNNNLFQKQRLNC